jgi:hypothetical protein
MAKESIAPNGMFEFSKPQPKKSDADHTYSGDVITATAGETVVIGDVCYLKADGKFWKMNATMEGWCPYRHCKYRKQHRRGIAEP